MENTTAIMLDNFSRKHGTLSHGLGQEFFSEVREPHLETPQEPGFPLLVALLILQNSFYQLQTSIDIPN